MRQNTNITEQAFRTPRQYGSFKSSGGGSYYLEEEHAEETSVEDKEAIVLDMRGDFNAMRPAYGKLRLSVPVSLKKFSIFARLHHDHVLCEAARCFYEKDSEKEAA